MKKQQWQAHIQAFNKSGLSKREYADSHKLVYHQFVYWSQKINQQSADAFVPVKLTLEQPIQKTTTPLGVLESPNGARLLIHSTQSACEIIGNAITIQYHHLVLPSAY